MQPPSFILFQISWVMFIGTKRNLLSFPGFMSGLEHVSRVPLSFVVQISRVMFADGVETVCSFPGFMNARVMLNIPPVTV